MVKCGHCKKMLGYDESVSASIKTGRTFFGHRFSLCKDCDKLLEDFYWEFIRGTKLQRERYEKKEAKSTIQYVYQDIYRIKGINAAARHLAADGELQSIRHEKKDFWFTIAGLNEDRLYFARLLKYGKIGKIGPFTRRRVDNFVTRLNKLIDSKPFPRYFPEGKDLKIVTGAGYKFEKR